MNSEVPSAELRPTVSSASPQMNRVGTLVGPIGWRSPRARYQASAASIAGGLPITDRCLSIALCGTPLRASGRELIFRYRRVDVDPRRDRVARDDGASDAVAPGPSSSRAQTTPDAAAK